MLFFCDKRSPNAAAIPIAGAPRISSLSIACAITS
jgi:hypothetical protein